MPSAAWRLDQRTAHLTLSPWDAMLDVSRPYNGVHDWRFNGSALELPKFVLGVEIDSIELEDVYVRGADLVATYSATSTRPTRVQVYWRAHVNDVGAGVKALVIDLQISVQTHLLDSNPALVASSYFRAEEICRLENLTAEKFHHVNLAEAAAKAPQVMWAKDCPACVIVRHARCDLSYAEMVHPVDQRRDTLTAERAVKSPDAAGQFKLSHELFLPPLEKGVILRGRVRGVFMPRQDDQSTVLASYAEFISAEPPLTT